MEDRLLHNQIQLLTGKKNYEEAHAHTFFIQTKNKYYRLFLDKCRGNNITLNDIADCVHNSLLRKEEHGDSNLDKWGRFDHDQSNLVRNGFDQSPIIDELILDVIKQLGLNVSNFWPQGKRAAVCLTHDVDSFDGRSYLILRKFWWLFNALVSGGKGQINTSQKYFAKIKRWGPRSYDPIYAFDNWMRLEDKYGFRSTFFFMAIRRALSIEGRRYSYKNPKVREVIQRLEKNGWEIGLHAGSHNPLDLSYLQKQKRCLEDILEKEIVGCRQHYLRVKYPESWILYIKAGFKYASNMGWSSGHNGFRAGTCHPYKPIDLKNFYEMPFQLMDSPTIEKPQEYHKLFLRYLTKIKSVKGCLVINFHQEHFDEIESPGTNHTYRMILETLANDKELWISTLNEVCTHICSKSKF
jgi:peptidoglycan/xylan/chitin deacetylase (PgdA/CDA1 family)